MEVKIKNMRYVYFIYLLGIAGLLQAQDSIPLPTEAIEVVKQFEPKAKDSKAIDYSPELIISDDLPPLSVSYEYPNEPLQIKYADPVIRPLVYENPKEPRSKTGYLKAGYGNINSLIVDSEMHYDIEDWFQVGFNLHHLSAKDTSEIVNQSMSHTAADLYFGYFLTELTKVTFAVNADLENRSLCCDDVDMDLERRMTTDLNRYGARLSLDHNSFSVSGLSTKQNLFASRLNSNLNDQEEWKYNYSSNTNKSLGDNGVINLKLGFEYLATDAEDNYQWSLLPNYLHKFDNLKIRLGAYASNADTLFLRPFAEATYNLPILDATAELSYVPNSSINTLHHLYGTMPYLANQIFSEYSYHRVQTLKLGVRRKDAKSSAYVGFLAKFHEDMAVYNIIDDGGQYTPNLFDYNQFGIQYSVTYQPFSVLRIQSDAQVRTFRKEGEEFDNAWLPKLTFGLKLEQILFDNNLTFFQSLRATSSPFGNIIFEDVAQEESLTGILDLSVGLEATIKKRFGIFAQAYNLLETRYQYFYNYPTFGRSFHAGLKLLF